MPEPAAILLSVRSPHVERLLEGSKTVELRRRPINVERGTLVLLYAAGERKEVVGSVTVEAVELAEPAQLWRRYALRVGVTRTEFDAYYSGAPIGCALIASNPRTLPEPIELAELRRRWDGFATPQTYRRVDATEFVCILNGERRLLC